MAEESPLFCHRCGNELHPGKGDFYVVRIEAFADPSPPELEPEEVFGSSREKMKQLVEQMEGMSEQELMDQVYRRMTIFLCGPCYRRWIDNPAGG
jgi:hypothetical protein